MKIFHRHAPRGIGIKDVLYTPFSGRSHSNLCSDSDVNRSAFEVVRLCV